MFQSGAAIIVVIYSQLTDATALLIAGTYMGVFVNGMLGGYGALISDLYPTEARAPLLRMFCSTLGVPWAVSAPSW